MATKTRSTSIHQNLDHLETLLNSRDDDFSEELELLESIKEDAGILKNEINDLNGEIDDLEEKVERMEEGGIPPDAIVVKLENIVLRQKLEDFIKREIYPYYNQQQANLFM